MAEITSSIFALMHLSSEVQPPGSPTQYGWWHGPLPHMKVKSMERSCGTLHGQLYMHPCLDRQTVGQVDALLKLLISWTVSKIIKDVYTLRIISWVLWNRRSNSQWSTIVYPILPMQCMLMAWRLKEPGHQLAWYWPNKPEYFVSSIRRVNLFISTF